MVEVIRRLRRRPCRDVGRVARFRIVATREHSEGAAALPERAREERHRVAPSLVTGSGGSRVDVAAAWGDRPHMRDLQPIIETLWMCIPIAELVTESMELTPDGDDLRGRC